MEPWTGLTWHRKRRGSGLFYSGNEPSGSISNGNFLTILGPVSFSRALLHVGSNGVLLI